MWVHPKEYEALGTVLADARTRSKLTQQQLAKKLRKPQSFVSSYERGQRRIDVLEFIRLADALASDPLALLSKLISGQEDAPKRASGKRVI